MDARTPRFLMANLGSEVSRILRYKEKGDMEMARKCFKRTEKILESIISAPEMEHRKGELEILRSVIADMLRNQPEYSVSGQEIKAYFLPFASAVTKQFAS